jgi:hypothetical protein
MLGRVLRIAGVLLALAVAYVAANLGYAHYAIRGLGGPLPNDLSALDGADLAVRVIAANTSRQALPRAQVLDPSRDPTPDRPYEMSHPAFLLTWADGRRLLVDVGMEPEYARGFGANLELAGAAPAESLGSAADQLPELSSGRLGVVFTHLHVDHVQGIGALCRLRGGGGEIEVFQTPRAGRAQELHDPPGGRPDRGGRVRARRPARRRPARARPRLSRRRRRLDRRPHARQPGRPRERRASGRRAAAARVRGRHGERRRRCPLRRPEAPSLPPLHHPGGRRAPRRRTALPRTPRAGRLRARAGARPVDPARARPPPGRARGSARGGLISSSLR